MVVWGGVMNVSVSGLFLAGYGLFRFLGDVATVVRLLFSGLLSLYVVPAVYSYLSRPVRQATAEEARLLGEPVG